MIEISVAVGLGIWIAVSGAFSYMMLRKDFSGIFEAAEGEKDKV